MKSVTKIAADFFVENRIRPDNPFEEMNKVAKATGHATCQAVANLLEKK